MGAVETFDERFTAGGRRPRIAHDGFNLSSLLCLFSCQGEQEGRKRPLKGLGASGALHRSLLFFLLSKRKSKERERWGLRPLRPLPSSSSSKERLTMTGSQAVGLFFPLLPGPS